MEASNSLGHAPDPISRGVKYQQRQKSILESAGALFNRVGLGEATLAMVASQVGLNLKSLRYYYKRRDDLVVAAFLESIAHHKRLAVDVAGIDDFEHRIASYVRRYVSLRAAIAMGKRPGLINFGDLRSLSGTDMSRVGEAYVDMFRATRQLFRPQDAAWGSGDRSAATHYLLSQMHWSVVWLPNYVSGDYPRAADRLTDILLHGLAITGKDVPVAPGVTGTTVPDKLSRESFLQAATGLINDIGYRGASVERISALLGVTKGAFYHHNDTRDALIASCFERTFAMIEGAQDAAIARGGSGYDRLASSIASLIEGEMSNEGQLLRTAALSSIGPELRRDMSRLLMISTGRFADMLSDGIADGSLKRMDVRIAAEVVTATINSAQELQRWVSTATRDNAVALYARPLLFGIRGRLPLAISGG